MPALTPQELDTMKAGKEIWSTYGGGLFKTRLMGPRGTRYSDRNPHYFKNVYLYADCFLTKKEAKNHLKMQNFIRLMQLAERD